MSSASSLDVQWKLELVLRLAGIASVMATSWFVARKLLPLLEKDTEDDKNKTERGKRILRQLGINSSMKLTDYELVIAAQVVQSVHGEDLWSEIGGLDNILDNINKKLLLPLLHSNMFHNSRLASAPKGALLYGPPGCGKTMIARGIASKSGFRFINVQMSFLLNKWYGESQKYTAAIFSLAKKLQPVVIFIDEIDSFLRNRESSDHEATAMIKAEVMALWDGITTDPNTKIILIGATNRPDDIDPAVRRRMPIKFYVPLPNSSQRSQIFKKVLQHECVCRDIDYEKLGQASEGLSGSDITEVCRQGVVKQMNLSIESNATSIGNVTQQDLLDEINTFKTPHLIHDDVLE